MVMPWLYIFIQILWVYVVDPKVQPIDNNSKPRVLILTDISSLTQDKGEPDDGQSMIRLLLYANELDIEGLIATSNLEHDQAVRPDLIKKVVEAYGKVRQQLVLHDRRYPSEADLSKTIFGGQPIAGREIAYQKSIGAGKDTDASQWIIRAVDKKDPRPLWVLIWGGSADLAQALWKVQKTRSPEALKIFVNKIRVHSIGHQDATGPWIVANFPALSYVLQGNSIRGMYRGGDTSLTRSDWVKKNIWNHGPLGDLYVDYNGGDIWSYKTGPVRGIKEGDSPSFLRFIPNGLNNINEPSWGGWGGRFRKGDDGKTWVDAVDKFANYRSDYDEAMATVYRWRSAWQSDFAARITWCATNYQNANHAPTIPGTTIFVRKRAGELVNLDQPGVIDPDGDAISYKWFFYPEASDFTRELPELQTNQFSCSFVAPQVARPYRLHLILEVSDNGTPSLVRYKRFVVTIDPTNH